MFKEVVPGHILPPLRRVSYKQRNISLGIVICSSRNSSMKPPVVAYGTGLLFCVVGSKSVGHIRIAIRLLLQPRSLTGRQLVKKSHPPHPPILKVHFRIHKSPLPVPNLSQISSVYVPHHTSWKSILKVTSHLCLGPPSGFLPSSSAIKTLYASLRYAIRATCTANPFFLIWSS